MIIPVATLFSVGVVEERDDGEERGDGRDAGTGHGRDEGRGFGISIMGVNGNGQGDPEAVKRAVRTLTKLVNFGIPGR